MELHFEPFELNPSMPPEGEDAIRYISRKYGRPPEQLAQTRAILRERGAAVGFEFGERSWIWNTFDAHRLLHWAGLEGVDKQRALKHAVLSAYHTHAENPGARDVLLRLAGEVGLDVERARAVLDSDEFTAPRCASASASGRSAASMAVPAVVIDGKHLISGGQPPEVFEQALRQIAAGA